MICKTYNFTENAVQFSLKTFKIKFLALHVTYIFFGLLKSKQFINNAFTSPPKKWKCFKQLPLILLCSWKNKPTLYIFWLKNSISKRYRLKESNFACTFFTSLGNFPFSYSKGHSHQTTTAHLDLQLTEWNCSGKNTIYIFWEITTKHKYILIYKYICIS